MSTHYYLSNRQRRDLCVRGSSLVIALPVSPEEPSDLTQWAQRAIHDVEPAWVRHVEETDLLVRMPPIGDPAHNGLTSLLGEIVTDERRLIEPRVVITVVVALVTLSMSAHPRHRIDRPQWPHSAIVNGGRVPKSSQDTP